MALSKADQKKLLKALKVSDDTIKTILDDDKEVALDLPDVVVFPAAEKARIFTEEELKIRDTAKAKDGGETMLEMQIKQYKKDNNLDFKGKDLKSLAEHLSANKDNDDVVKKLRENLNTAEQKALDAENKANGILTKSKLAAAVKPTNNGLSNEKVLALMAVDGYEFKEEAGVLTPYLNGIKVLDEKLQTPVTYDAVILSYQTANKLIGEAEAGGGRQGGGGGSSKQSAKPLFTKASEVQKAFEDKYGAGSAMGTEHDYAGHLNKAMKEAEAAGTALIMD